MAGQGFFCRPVLTTCRFLFNNRLLQINQIAGVKQSAKNVKVPDKPKKPLTPYFRFVQERRGSLVKEHPEWKVTQVTIQCASEWKTLDPSAKLKYESKYKDDMEEYADKYLKYNESLTDEQKEALKDAQKEKKDAKLKREKKKKMREYGRPKRPLGAYMQFVVDQAKAQPGVKYQKLLTDLKDKWSSLPEGEKSIYIEEALKAWAVYDKELKDWEIKMIQQGNVDLVRRGTLTPKPKKTNET